MDLPENVPSPEELNKIMDEMEAEIGALRGRKLVYKQKCAIVAVLIRRPFLRPALARKFKLSETTLSHLSRCVRGGGQSGTHYMDIYSEYMTLGEEAFLSKHYDNDLHYELMKIMMDNNLYTKHRRQRWSAEWERREKLAKAQRKALGLDS